MSETADKPFWALYVPVEPSGKSQQGTCLAVCCRFETSATEQKIHAVAPPSPLSSPTPTPSLPNSHRICTNYKSGRGGSSCSICSILATPLEMLPQFGQSVMYITVHTSFQQYLVAVTHTLTHTTVLRPFFRDHLGEPAPEENFWTFWCKGRLTEADTPAIRLGSTPSGLSSAHLHHPPNKHKQSTKVTVHQGSIDLFCH